MTDAATRDRAPMLCRRAVRLPRSPRASGKGARAAMITVLPEDT